MLERIHNFSKVAGYKTNTQKSVVFPHTTNKLSEGDVKKTIPFTIASNRKYLGINLNKEVKDLYIEIYNTLIKEIEKTKINGKILCSHGHKKFNC